LAATAQLASPRRRAAAFAAHTPFAAGTSWPGNKVLLPMGISIHPDYDDLAAHSVPTACPAAPTSLADAAANALVQLNSGLTAAQKAVASSIVARAKAYVPNTAATRDLWVALQRVRK
jgi:hypothetical protein